jgi:hypothetical protein
MRSGPQLYTVIEIIAIGRNGLRATDDHANWAEDRSVWCRPVTRWFFWKVLGGWKMGEP